MPHTANITTSRFKARTIYLEDTAYQHLQDGPVTLLLGTTGNTSVVGTVKSCNHGRQGFVVCQALYTQSSLSLPLLPLQLNDWIEYDTSGGQIRIIAIHRSSRSPISSPQTITCPASPPPILTGLGSSFVTTGNLPAYLSQNGGRIVQLNPQALPPRGKEYLGWTNPVMQRLYARFPGLNIQRADVVKLYSEWKDPELALVTSVIWGGINATRPHKSGPPDLVALLSHSSTDIVDRMNHIRDLILANNISQAFGDCSIGGIAKFKGVGSAFFTKIFFFIGQSAPGLQLEPLVFDKWTQNAFFLLFTQVAGVQASHQFFRIPTRQGFKTQREAIGLTSGIAKQTSAYLEYVTRMNAWAGSLGVPPAQLEQFVFGDSRKQNKAPTNPRTEIVNLIKTYLPPL